VPEHSRGAVMDITVEQFLIQVGEGYAEQLTTTLDENLPALDQAFAEESATLLAGLDRFRRSGGNN
jgi:hypothetical protein